MKEKTMTAMDKSNFLPGMILVRFKTDITSERAVEVTNQHGGEIKNWIGEKLEGLNLAVIRVPNGDEIAKVEEFSDLPEVNSAGLNYQGYTCGSN